MPVDTGARSGPTGTYPSTEEDSGVPPTTNENEAIIAVNIGVAVGGVYAESLAGGYVFMLAQDAGPTGIWMVEPGTWWITAMAEGFDAGGVGVGACNRSDTVELEAQDRFEWTISEFPGMFDGDGCCVLP